MPSQSMMQIKPASRTVGQQDEIDEEAFQDYLDKESMARKKK